MDDQVASGASGDAGPAPTGPAATLSGEAGGADPALWEVKVKTLEPATYTLAMGAQSTVGELKDAVERVSGVAASQQRLLFCGRVLSDDTQVLEGAGVQPGHTVHMVERPPDLPPQPQNNVPPPRPQVSARPPNVVQRFAIGTINSAGDELPNMEQVISGLLNVVGSTIQGIPMSAPGTVPVSHPGQVPASGAPGAQGQPVQPGPAGTAPPAAPGAPAPFQQAQVEISIDAVPAAGVNMHRMLHRGPPPPNTHPLESVRGFIPRIRSLLEQYEDQGSLFSEEAQPQGGAADANAPSPGEAGEGESSASTSRPAAPQHFDVECDICGARPITRSRFKSLAHPNYDLCQDCVRSEGARQQAPYVRIDAPLFGHFDTAFASGPMGVRPLTEQAVAQRDGRLRAAARNVIGGVVGEGDATASARGQEDEIREETEVETSLDALAVQAACELVSRASELMSEQGNGFLSSEATRIAADVQEACLAERSGEGSDARHAVQGDIIRLSTMLSSFGGLFAELGRIFEGLRLRDPNSPEAGLQPVLRGSAQGYVHGNACQASLPPPLGAQPALLQLLAPGIRPMPTRVGGQAAQRGRGGQAPRRGMRGAIHVRPGVAPSRQAGVQMVRGPVRAAPPVAVGATPAAQQVPAPAPAQIVQPVASHSDRVPQEVPTQPSPPASTLAPPGAAPAARIPTVNNPEGWAEFPWLPADLERTRADGSPQQLGPQSTPLPDALAQPGAGAAAPAPPVHSPADWIPGALAAADRAMAAVESITRPTPQADPSLATSTAEQGAAVPPTASPREGEARGAEARGGEASAVEYCAAEGEARAVRASTVTPGLGLGAGLRRRQGPGLPRRAQRERKATRDLEGASQGTSGGAAGSLGASSSAQPHLPAPPAALVSRLMGQARRAGESGQSGAGNAPAAPTLPSPPPGMGGLLESMLPMMSQLLSSTGAHANGEDADGASSREAEEASDVPLREVLTQAGMDAQEAAEWEGRILQDTEEQDRMPERKPLSETYLQLSE